MNENILIEKLNRLSDAWKAQFKTPPNIPLQWSVVDGMVYLDDTWIAPVAFLKQESLDEAVEWVNPVVMEVPLKDGFLNIVIVNQFGHFEINGIERSIISTK